MQQIHVDLGNASYTIHIDKGCLSRSGSIIKDHLRSPKVAIITNNTVGCIYGDALKNSLKESDIEVETIEIPDGEEYKSLVWVNNVFDALVEYRMNRQSSIIAIGGGVVGDLAGFVAATYMRGIPFIQIPTSLIAQVDSSIGGKTAVNHPKAKNLIGAFHQPKFVLIDINVLQSLPQPEFRNGLAEVIKHGMIMDEELFEYMEFSLSKILSMDMQCIEQMVSRSCRDKAEIVEKDEKEHDIRAILNYGHTIGHGIEAATNYTMFRHGEAVSIGMVVAARIAVNMDILEEKQALRQNRLLEKYGLPVVFPDLDINAIIDAIGLDKKREKKPRFVLPKDIGEGIIIENVSDGQIEKAMKETKDKWL